MKTLKATLLSVLLSCALPDALLAQVILHADTPQTSQDGHRFTAPSGWSIQRQQSMIVLSAPEADSRIAFVDVQAADADTAVRLAWQRFAANSKPVLQRSRELPVRQGWREVRGYSYASSEHRVLSAVTRRADSGFNVAIFDMAAAIVDKRDAEIELALGSLVPKDYVSERFSGITAQPMTGERLKIFERFIERARLEFAVPGVAVGLIQNGKVVLAKGFGVRRLGEPAPVNADTRFLIASNTKPLTTLMLAKLVDAGKFSWDTKVTQVMPGFKLGNAMTTEQVRMRHLVCACTGLPRQDMEFIFEGENLTPDAILSMVASMQVTSPFGALYQYSNLMAGAAGYIGGKALHPTLETGAAYDAAMQELVFDPLGMRATTFDDKKVRRGNFASPHALDSTGKMTHVDFDSFSINQASRPDGAAWSTVGDLLRYLQMELNYGRLPDGSRYISPAPLLARRVQQVSRGNQLGYGIGLKIDESSGTTMLHHGGTAAGFISDMIWWPEHDVGAVILTNASGGGTALRNVFRRRLMELMFDGHAEAEPNLKIFQAMNAAEAATWRASLQRPVPKSIYQRLLARYYNAALGEIKVSQKRGATYFDFGGWKSEMAVRKDDASTLITTAPGNEGFELRLMELGTLELTDGERTYVFTAR